MLVAGTKLLLLTVRALFEVNEIQPDNFEDVMQESIRWPSTQTNISEIS